MWRSVRAIDKLSGIAAMGLAATIVPFAVLVHLFAEAMALGFNSLDSAFWLRHLYLGVLIAGTAAWSARTLGLSVAASERRRRCALLIAQLRSGTAGLSAASLTCANVAFFGVSQLVEGVPIASGDWYIGLIASVVGSAVCALFLCFFGRSLIVAAFVAMFKHKGVTPRLAHSEPTYSASRCASAAFSLFIPSRPPPIFALA